MTGRFMMRRIGDSAVVQIDFPLAMSGHIRIVSDDQNRPPLGVEPREDRHHLVARRRVEVAGKVDVPDDAGF